MLHFNHFVENITSTLVALMEREKILEKNTSLFIHNNHFCLIWKSNGIGFNEVIEKELKLNFKVVDNVISDKHVKRFIKY